MDYHRYNSLGIGSVPPLLPGPPSLGSGNALTEHATATSGAGPPMPGGQQSLLAPPHPSLMFHYGVGGKPTGVPPHLLSGASVSIANSINNSSSSSNITNHNSTLTNSKASGRTTAASIGTNLPPISRSTSPNSSFAAALRSLAKQATGPGSEAEICHNEVRHEASPKPVSSSSGLSMSSAPVVSMAPPHYSLADMRKDGVLPAEIERLGPEDMVRGFQPYRAPDMPTVSAASQLRPSLPLELTHAYQPYPSLYPHHMSHPYRVEEQMYLERYGLLRPTMAPYGLSALYQTSPYLSARFPPELIPTSLHPSSALLHERLKLEEDIRQREYELELRRERELERERERGREKERERRQKDENERSKEDRKSLECLRDRSPLNHATLWNSSSSSSSSSYSKKGQPSGIPSQSVIRSSESRLSKSSDTSKSSKVYLESPSKVEKPNSKPRISTIVRPFESTAVVPPPPVVSLISSSSSSSSSSSLKPPEEVTIDDKKSKSETPKTFSVWQPMKLSTTESTSKSSYVSTVPICQTAAPIQLPSPFNPFDHIKLAPNLTQMTPVATVTSSSNSVVIPLYSSAQTSTVVSHLQVTPIISTAVITSAPLLPKLDGSKPVVVPVVSTLHQPFLTSATTTPVVAINTSSSPSSTIPNCKKIKLSMTPTGVGASSVSSSNSKKVKPEPALVPVIVPELVPVSRLDTEEKRLKELKDSGMLASEAEETLLEELQNSSKYGRLLCSKGPPAPIDKSTEKLEFFSMFGLTTHEKANQVLLDRCERRAEVLIPLAPFCSLEQETKAEESISDAHLTLKLVPGLNLTETPKMKSTSSLLIDFSGKSRFLQNLNMIPQHSVGKHKEIERIWKLVMEERLRRYEPSEEIFDKKISAALKTLLMAPSSTPSTIEKNATSLGPLLPITSKSNVIFTSANINAAPLSNKVQPSMKGIIEDRIFGIGKYLTAENDPLISSLSGFDKMIDHFVKNAQAEGGNENAALLSHIEQVRSCQVSVCETAELVQEQVSKLIATRSQLETHRAALHHHLTSITNLLASKNNLKSNCSTSNNNFRVPTLAVGSISSAISSTNNNMTLSSPIYCTVQSSNTNVTNSIASHLSRGPNPAPTGVPTLTKVVPQPIIPASTVMSWAGLPFLSSSNIPPGAKESPYYPLPSPQQHHPPHKHVVTTNSSQSTKPSLSTPKSATSTRTPTKVIPHKPQSNPKFNGAPAITTNPCSIPKHGSKSIHHHPSPLPITTSLPIMKATSSVGSSPLKLTSTSKNSASGMYQNSKNVPYLMNQSATSNNSKSLTKNPVGFAPYSKSSPSRVQSWLPN